MAVDELTAWDDAILSLMPHFDRVWHQINRMRGCLCRAKAAHSDERVAVRYRCIIARLHGKLDGLRMAEQAMHKAYMASLK